MQRVPIRLPLLGLLASVCGCANDPGDFVADALWWINAADAFPDNCAEQGIDTIRVEVLPQDDDDAPQEQRFPCEIGQGQMRVQRASSPGFSLPGGGRYRYVIDALDARDNVLHSVQGTFEEATSPGFVELPVVDIFSPLGEAASLSAEWQFTDAGDLEQACDARGVTHVAVDVASASDPEFMDAIELTSAPCTDGVLIEAEPILATGEYWMRYVALDEDNGVEQLGEPLDVSVPSAGLDIPLATWTFE